MSWVALDIGGANIKAADGRAWAYSKHFPLWRNPQGLAGALSSMLALAPAAELVAVTMTGELCDAFRTKTDGVRHILSSVQSAAASREVRVYLLDGRLATVEEALRLPHLAAASNWHVLAKFACGLLEGRNGLLIDIGSTTTDIIPLAGGEPRPSALTDTERLLTGELVYTGVGRTPVCAIVRYLPWRGEMCPVAAELFATSADAYVVLGQLPEQFDADWTADGRPLTRQFCVERLGRMICADPAAVGFEEAAALAAAIRAAQVGQIRHSLQQVRGQMSCLPEGLVLSGRGEFLAKGAANGDFEGEVVSLGQSLGPAIGSCAPAYALARFAQLLC